MKQTIGWAGVSVFLVAVAALFLMACQGDVESVEEEDVFIKLDINWQPDDEDQYLSSEDYVGLGMLEVEGLEASGGALAQIALGPVIGVGNSIENEYVNESMIPKPPSPTRPLAVSDEVVAMAATSIADPGGGAAGQRFHIWNSGTYDMQGEVFSGVTIHCNDVHILNFEATQVGQGRWLFDTGGYDNITIERGYLHHSNPQNPNPNYGWGIAGGGRNVWIKNCVVTYFTGLGIVAGTDWLVEDTIISHATDLNEDGRICSGDADLTRGFGDNIVIRNCELGPTYMSETSGGPHIDGFQSYTTNGESCTNFQFYSNRVVSVGQAVFCHDWTEKNGGPDRLHTWWIYNNIVTDIWGKALSVRRCANAIFANNTVRNSAYSGIIIDVECPGSMVVNNILDHCYYLSDYTKAPLVAVSAQGLVVSNNCAYPQRRTDHDTIWVDPMLNDDFTLQAGSPCIDAGIALTEFDTDYFGTIRPQGSGWDIGAHEFGGPTPTVTPTYTPTPTPIPQTPTPTPTPTATATPLPPTPSPTATATPTPEPTVIPTPAPTPVPTPTQKEEVLDLLKYLYDAVEAYPSLTIHTETDYSMLMVPIDSLVGKDVQYFKIGYVAPRGRGGDVRIDGRPEPEDELILREIYLNSRQIRFEDPFYRPIDPEVGLPEVYPIQYPIPEATPVFWPDELVPMPIEETPNGD